MAQHRMGPARLLRALQLVFREVKLYGLDCLLQGGSFVTSMPVIYPVPCLPFAGKGLVRVVAELLAPAEQGALADA